MPVRIDHQIISQIIPEKSKVLDLGCGNGELLSLLQKENKARVQGVDIDENSIYECVAKGLSVVHSDIDNGLRGYPDQSFDFVILNQSLQEVRHVDMVLKGAFRVGKQVIVGFSNFGEFKSRAMLFFRGKSPVTPALPYFWYETPNVHFITIKDFQIYCHAMKLHVLKTYYFSKFRRVRFWPNLRAAAALFILDIS